jgi:hypothetical protein
VQLVDAYVRTGVEPSDRTDPEYEQKRIKHTHRYTYRIQYQARGERALSKERARDTQLLLRAVLEAKLPILLT